MARKRVASVDPPLGRKVIEQTLKRNDFLKAMELAKTLATQTPTDDHKKLYADTLRAAFESFTTQGKVKAVVETLKAGAEFATANAIVAEDIAVLHAKAGEFSKALQLSNSPRVNGHIADLCVNRGKADGASEQHKTDLATILKAFHEYEAGRDDAAREASQAIGLTSPYLQWRVLLRGLTAYSTGDNARAIENWQRLNNEYLPAKLSNPLRAKIDPKFRDSLPASLQSQYQQQAENLNGNEVTKGLRAIQRFTGREQSLREVWKHAVAVVRTLKPTQPQLVDRLGQVLYHAILRQGEPSDLKEYRTIFGAPADDPKFLKLEGIIFESMNEIEPAVKRWKEYEAWLASKPAGWPDDLRDLTRAKLLHRIGGLLEDLDEDEFGDDHDGEPDFRSPLDILESMFRPRKVRKPTEVEDPTEYYRRSVALAPNWPQGVQEMIEYYQDCELHDEAVKYGEQFLERNSGNIPILQAVAKSYKQLGQPLGNITTLRKALATNPLDEGLSVSVALAYVSGIRHFLIQNQFRECERLLEEGKDPTEKRLPGTYGSLKVMVARKQGRNEEADAIEQPLVEVGRYGWMSSRYQLSVLGLVTKLKPAVRKPADVRLNEAFACSQPKPQDVLHLYSAWSIFRDEQIEYRGQMKHEKQILTLCERSLQASIDPKCEEDYERLLGHCLEEEQGKLVKKMAASLQLRFANNPMFYVMQAQALLLEGKGSYRLQYQLMNLLHRASEAAKNSTQPRHQQVLEMLSVLNNQIGGSPMPMPFFD